MAAVYHDYKTKLSAVWYILDCMSVPLSQIIVIFKNKVLQTYDDASSDDVVSNSNWQSTEG